MGRRNERAARPATIRVEEPDHRGRTLGLLVAFAALVVVGVLTVLLPALASDEGETEGPPALETTE